MNPERKADQQERLDISALSKCLDDAITKLAGDEQEERAHEARAARDKFTKLPNEVIDLFFSRELKALSNLTEEHPGFELGMHLTKELRPFIGDNWNDSTPINVVKGELVAVSARWNSRFPIPDRVITRALANPTIYNVQEFGSEDNKLAVILINPISS